MQVQWIFRDQHQRIRSIWLHPFVRVGGFNSGNDSWSNFYFLHFSFCLLYSVGDRPLATIALLNQFTNWPAVSRSSHSHQLFSYAKKREWVGVGNFNWNCCSRVIAIIYDWEMELTGKPYFKCPGISHWFTGSIILHTVPPTKFLTMRPSRPCVQFNTKSPIILRSGVCLDGYRWRVYSLCRWDGLCHFTSQQPPNLVKTLSDKFIVVLFWSSTDHIFTFVDWNGECVLRVGWCTHYSVVFAMYAKWWSRIK